MKLSAALLIGLVGLALPNALSAQARGGGGDARARKEIPANERPPAGMCRIWLDDVPAAQQPAPTDCTSAVRNRPAKGRVIFGDDYVEPNQGDTLQAKPAIKGFGPAKSGV
jgi:hypothetical protein